LKCNILIRHKGGTTLAQERAAEKTWKSWRRTVVEIPPCNHKSPRVDQPLVSSASRVVWRILRVQTWWATCKLTTNHPALNVPDWTLRRCDRGSKRSRLVVDNILKWVLAVVLEETTWVCRQATSPITLILTPPSKTEMLVSTALVKRLSVEIESSHYRLPRDGTRTKSCRSISQHTCIESDRNDTWLRFASDWKLSPTQEMVEYSSGSSLKNSGIPFNEPSLGRMGSWCLLGPSFL
jgi:hypothetical protein